MTIKGETHYVKYNLYRNGCPQNSFNLCALDGHTGEILGETQCSSDAKNVLKFVNRVQEQFEEEAFVKVGYEAGCLGYALYHSLTTLGLHCDILAQRPCFALRKIKSSKMTNWMHE